jgi:FtsP/CotA-like multicopper oxidase with cupredoxin domain
MESVESCVRGMRHPVLAAVLLALALLFAVSCDDDGGRRAVAAEYMPQTRSYFIAAESVQWNFAPLGRDPVFDQPIPGLAPPEFPQVRYVQYTDATFTTRVEQPPWLGILGPILRGVVGDTLKVTFRNATDHKRYSIHPHGVRYDKESEGAPYGADPGPGAAVAPGEEFTYTWELDAGAGPAPGEPSSKVWLYHSHVDEVQDVLDGLVGAIVVTDPAKARGDGTPSDVDREFVTLFFIFSPNLNAINGFIYGNLQGLEMNRGDHVRWYVIGLGSVVDVHTPHWHGETVLLDGRTRTDVVELLPASMHVADMVADNPGTWLFHCHVAPHMRNGMFTTYHVR